MKFPFCLLIVSLVAFSLGCTPRPTIHADATSTATTQTASDTTPLLLISIDGYRNDYLERGLSPTLAMLAAGGVRAESMQPAFPSLTFPNHYTLVTGLTPDHHGIVNNTMFDQALGKFSLSIRKAVSNGRWWDQGTPIWETASAHGLRSATMFWPGSEADIHGKHPDYWKPFDSQFHSNQRVDQVLAWLDLPADQRPTFLTLYFEEVDHAGHKFGPDTPQVDQALRDTDAALARLVDGLKQRGLLGRINLLVVSDHGMASTPAANTVLIDERVSLKTVRTVSMGILAGFNPRSDSVEAAADFDTARTALEQPHPHMQCWDKSRVPARLAYGSNPRVPQLLCLANVGWRISTSDFVAKRGSRMSLGEHGYDNALPEMQALFVAHGPAFQTGITVPAFSNVDVYPLMTHLLGIPPAANDGDYNAVKGMLKASLQ